MMNYTSAKYLIRMADEGKNNLIWYFQIWDSLFINQFCEPIGISFCHFFISNERPSILCKINEGYTALLCIKAYRIIIR